MDSQLTLTFGTRQPHATHAGVAMLIELLRGQGWTKARRLMELTGLDDRAIRAIAGESKGKITSSDKGYKITRECTPSELAAGIRRRRSQIRVSEQRIIDELKEFHRSE